MEEYECDQCGACCKGFLRVHADWADTRREPRILEVQVASEGHKDGDVANGPVGDASKPATQLVMEYEEPTRLAILNEDGGPCPFLGSDSKCGIYPTRPSVCVTFHAGDRLCQESRSHVGLPPLEPVDA